VNQSSAGEFTLVSGSGTIGFCSTIGAFCSKAGGVGAGAERFEDPNQSSDGDEGLVVAAGACGAGGGLEEAGVEERFALANQSSTGVATFGETVGVCGTTGLGWGCARFEEPN
jgi:hypothetical protein